MNCAKHPTKPLTKKRIAVKWQQAGKHIEIIEEKVAWCCDRCGIVALDTPQAKPFVFAGTSVTSSNPAPWFGNNVC